MYDRELAELIEEICSIIAKANSRQLRTVLEFVRHFIG